MGSVATAIQRNTTEKTANDVCWLLDSIQQEKEKNEDVCRLLDSSHQQGKQQKMSAGC